MRHLIILIFTTAALAATAQGIITRPHTTRLSPDIIAARVTDVAKAIGGSLNASESMRILLSTPENEAEAEPQPQHLTVNNADGNINDHGYVDLGLPSGTRWARCNVGAAAPNKSGEYYAWGEIYDKSEYTMANSATYGQDYPHEIKNLPKYDAAASNWGATWSLPSAEDVQELIDNCTFIIVQYKYAIGYLATGPNGKSIFLPAGGWKTAASNPGYGLTTNIWTATPDKDGAMSFAIQKDENGNPSPVIIQAERYIGANVRPIAR